MTETIRHRQPDQVAIKKIEGNCELGGRGRVADKRLPFASQETEKREGQNGECQNSFFIIWFFLTREFYPSLFSVFGFVLLYLFHWTFCLYEAKPNDANVPVKARSEWRLRMSHKTTFCERKKFRTLDFFVSQQCFLVRWRKRKKFPAPQGF